MVRDRIPMAWIEAAVHSAARGSFTAAATALELTPAAVSKSVAALEARLAVRLFNRSTRRLSMTDEGRAYVERARQGIETLHSAAAAATAKGPPAGLVRVNAPVGFGRVHVLPHLPAFFAAYPGVRVDLVLDDRPGDLLQGGFDLGIRGGSEPPEGYVARKICDLPVAIVATPRYLAARGTPRSPAELEGHDLLRIRFLSGRLLPWLFRDGVRTLAWDGEARLALSDPQAILDAALAHLGIAWMARHHAAESIAAGRLVELLADRHVAGDGRMSLFYPHRTGMAPRVRALADHLLAAWSADRWLHDRPQVRRTKAPVRVSASASPPRSR